MKDTNTQKLSDFVESGEIKFYTITKKNVYDFACAYKAEGEGRVAQILLDKKGGTNLFLDNGKTSVSLEIGDLLLMRENGDVKVLNPSWIIGADV